MSSSVTHKEKIFNIFHHTKDIFIYDEDGKKYHIHDILDKSLIVATYLQQKGYKEGDSIGLISSSGRDYLIGFIGILLAKCIVAIIDPYFNSDIITAQIRQCDIKCILIDRTLDICSRLPFGIQIIQYLKRIHLGFLSYHPTLSLNTISRSSHHEDYRDSSFDDTLRCSYIPTGGTTDSPKIVIYSYKNFLQSIERISQLPITGERFLADLPYLGVIGLLLGKSVFFHKTVSNIEDIIPYINKRFIDILFLPPNKLHGKYNIPDNIKTILLGSAPIYKPFLQQLKKRIWLNTQVLGLYGMTECLPISRYYMDDKLKETKEDFLGILCNDIEVDIKDNELLIKQENICDGYIGVGKKEYIQTGDIVKIEDNKLYILGRKKNMIIINGVNIYPSLYEGLYLSIPGIKKAVLFGVYDEKSNDELLVIAFELDQGVGYITQIKESIKKIIIHKDVILHNMMIGNIPTKGRQQKIDYATLKSLYLSQYHD